MARRIARGLQSRRAGNAFYAKENRARAQAELDEVDPTSAAVEKITVRSKLAAEWKALTKEQKRETPQSFRLVKPAPGSSPCTLGEWSERAPLIPARTGKGKAASAGKKKTKAKDGTQGKGPGLPAGAPALGEEPAASI